MSLGGKVVVMMGDVVADAHAVVVSLFLPELQPSVGLPVILAEHHLVYLLGLGDLYDYSQDGSSTVLGRLPCGVVVWGVCVVERVWGEEVGRRRGRWKETSAREDAGIVNVSKMTVVYVLSLSRAYDRTGRIWIVGGIGSNLGI